MKEPLNQALFRGCVVLVSGLCLAPLIGLTSHHMFGATNPDAGAIAVLLASAASLLLSLLAMGISYVTSRGSIERMAGFCMMCGYDLTGNVSGRCPECGHYTVESW